MLSAAIIRWLFIGYLCLNNDTAYSFYLVKMHLMYMAFFFYLVFLSPRLVEEKQGDIVFHFPSFCPSIQVVGTLCMQLLLQFYSDSFETIQVLRSWSEDVHIIWISFSDHFLSLFPQNEFSHFSSENFMKIGRKITKLWNFL